MVRRPRLARSVVALGALCASAVLLLRAFASPPEDPLGDLRARTVALSEADLTAACASDPSMAVMLAERLAHRDLRGEIARIADLFESADRGLAGSPWLRAEAALLGARLLSFDEGRAPAAVDRLRAAADDPALPEAARAHALFGLGFLVSEPKEQLRLLLQVVEKHPDSAYAPPATAEAAARAWDLHLWNLIFEIEHGLSLLPDHGVEARRLFASRLVDRIRDDGVGDTFRDLPGNIQHRLSSASQAGSAHGMLIRLSLPRHVEDDLTGELYDGEQDAPEILRTWAGDAPAKLLDGLPPARYLALVSLGSYYESQLYEISSTAAEARVGPDGLVLHACDARTGAPRAGTRFIGGWYRSKDYGQRAVWTPLSVEADVEGIARVPIDPPLQAGEELQVSVRACHAEGGADVEAELSGADRSTDGVRVALFAAKPLVRPGDTLDFRLVAREPSSRGTMTVPKGARFSVSLEDGEGTVFHQEVLAVSEFGTATSHVTVPDSAALGPVKAHVERQDAGLRIRDPQWSGWDGEMQTFTQFLCRVEEYRLPELTMTLETDRPWYVSPGTARVTVRVEATEGGPVAGFEGALGLDARRSTWTEPDPLAELPFLLPPPEESDFSLDYVDNGVDLRIPETTRRFVTDADGRATIDLPLRRVLGSDLVQVRVEAEGADPQGRSAHGSTSFRLVRNPARIRLSLDWDWSAPRIGGTALLLDPLDRRVAAPLRVTVYALDGQEVTRRDLEAGGGALSIDGLPGGTYRVDARAEVDGQVITARDWAWVWGSGGTLRSEKIELRGDRGVYRPGETLTARAIVPDGVQAVLATLENDHSLAARCFPVKDGAAEIAIPLPPEAAPNVRLVVSTWKDGVYQEGSLDRFVEAGGAPLSVEVTADPPTAPPGEEASWTVRVRDAAGKPVDAEVALAVVDARVFALQEDPAPALLRCFAALPKRYRVVHERSRFSREEVSSGESTGATAAFSMSEESGGDDAMSAYEPVIRRAFHDLAGWFPMLRTGPTGRVTVKARFSDSLTQWRATARAFGSDGSAGETRGEARTLLPVTLRLDAPTLVHRGDETEIGVLVRNHGDAARSGTVSLEIDGLTSEETAPRQVDLSAGGSTLCRWRVKAGLDVASARVRAVARLGDVGDAVEKSLPVLTALTRVPFTAALRLDGHARGAWIGPESPVSGSRRLEVRAAPEDLERLLAPLDELLHYPYGCAEQTMSGFLPAVVVRATLDGLGIRPQALSLQVAAVSQAGVGRLLGFQHEDGGWGWWTGDATDPFMTIYVVNGLLLAKTHGVEVDEAGLARGVDCLAGLAPTLTDPEERAFARWVLAVAGRTPEGAEAKPGPGSSAVEIAYTLRAAHRSHNAAEVARLSKLLVDTADASQEGRLRWAGSRGFLAMAPVATSLAIEALIEADVEAPAVQAGLRWLGEHRSGSAYGSTIANAYATLACARDLAARGGHLVSADVKLRVGGKDVASEPAEQGDPVTRWLLSALNGMEVENAGDGPISLWVRGEDWVADEHLPTGGVVWTRGLWRLLPGGEPEREDCWAEVGAEEPVAVGPMYEVRYQIHSTVEYLAVDDPRPAGLVPVRPVSGFDERSGAYVEWRERATTAFVRDVTSTTLIRLPVRFDTPGRVLWPAARAFAMYDESRQGFAPSRWLQVASEASTASSGTRIDGLRLAHVLWQAEQVDERAWSSWRRIALDLNEAERSELRALARAVRGDSAEWNKYRDTVVDGLLRVARPDDPRDVDLLLELEDGDRGDTALSNAETWCPFETELARVAVQRRSERAWAILEQVLEETGEPDAVLDAMDEAGPRLRARCLGEFARWFAGMVGGDLFWGSWNRVAEENSRNDERMRTLLIEWMERHRPGEEALAVCKWAHDKVAEHPGDAAWESFRLAAVQAAAALEDREALRLGSRNWGLGSMHDALARRAVAEGDLELWASLVQDWAGGGVSPRAALDTLAGAEGPASDAVLDAFVDNWFTFDPPRTWGTPEEWRADVDRLVAVVSKWDAAHKAGGAASTGVRVSVFAWMSDVLERVRANGEPEAPGWKRLLEDMHAGFAGTDPVAAAGAGAFEMVDTDAIWDDPTIVAWIGDRWLELAPFAPDLVLFRLRRGCEFDDRAGVIARAASLPPAARAALLGQALKGDWDGSQPWLEAFAADGATEVRARVEECLLRHVDDSRWDGVFSTRPEVVVAHLGDPSACTLGVAARLGLEAALPALGEIAQRAPAFLVARASVLREWPCPGVHVAVQAALAATGKDVDEGTRRTLAYAELLTRPMKDAAAVFEVATGLRAMDGQTADSWERDMRTLGLRGDADVVQAAIADARQPHVALLLALGASGRHDARLQAAWRADLDGQGVRRDVAFLALAYDGSREAADLLVGWLATEAGRRFLVRPSTTGSELPDDGSIHAGYLGDVEIVTATIEQTDDPVAAAIESTLPRLSGMLPSRLAWRMISEAHPKEIPLLLVRWIAGFRADPETTPAAMEGMLALSTRILGPARFVNEPGAVALTFLEGLERGMVRARLAQATDREFVACARLVAYSDEEEDAARLERIAAGDDPLLARHARAAMDWLVEVRKLMDPPPFDLARVPNPFAVPAEQVVVDALRRRFGEDPFAPTRGR